jgi:hypothetical protein
MNSTVRSIRNFFVSLKLTVALLACGLVLVFVATLAQVDLGIYTIQKEFFHSFIAIWHVGSLYIPLPGGYLVGGLLLINLLAAQIYRLKLDSKKIGIWLTHAGLIVLLIGELLAGLLQEDYSMTIVEGETKNYSESFHDNELAVVDASDPAFDDVVAIPETFLAKGKEVQHPKLPFRVVTRVYYPNSNAAPINSVPNPPPPLATKGTLASRFVFTPAEVTYKPNENNVPFAVVELIGAEGSLGTWALTPQVPALRTLPSGETVPSIAVPNPQRLDYGGKTWELSLRAAREYKPFNLQLLKVTHEVYVGTDRPKNFASRLKLTTPDGRENREVLIYMNNPLRYGGYTFYQYQMDSARGQTVLQVVRNPGWLLPYIACIMMGVGLVVQFTISLVIFGRKQRNKAAEAAKR